MSKLSALQMCSSESPEDNLATIERLLTTLSPQANQLVLLPENALCFADKNQYLSLAETLNDGPYQHQLACLAKRFNCYLVCGSFPIKSEFTHKIYTSCLVFSPSGTLVSHYHKIHLFDALIADSHHGYKESDTFIPGEKLQLFDWKTEHASYKVGLAICYDLRFPDLFQSLRSQGADILLLPAAFTKVTGAAHWLPLLQARAIENQCYIVAAGQSGLHPCMRETHGHSMIVSPWGEVLDEIAMNPGSVCCDFSKQSLDKLRTDMPILSHNRFTRVLK